MSEKFVTYEAIEGGTIARIMLNRPESRNAQNRGLLVELDEAFLRAEADDAVRVVILGGMGKMFSAGHDMGSKEMREEWSGDNPHPTRLINGGTRKGAEQRMLQEWHYYFENTRRWRNLRKITIAQVLKDAGDRDMGAIKAIGTACMDSEDFREGRTAFMDKRKPRFHGR